MLSFLFLIVLFFSGAAAYCDESKQFYGYIDKTGRFSITPQWDDTTNFSEGLAFVRRGEQYFCVSPKGKIQFKLPSGVSPAGAFSEGRCLVHSKGKFGFISTSGRTVVPAVYSWPTPSPFHNGTAFGQINGKTVKVVLIDKNGHLLKKFEKLRIRSFGEGIACLSQGKISNYFDFAGNRLFETKYLNGGSFSDGVAEVTLNGKDETNTTSRALKHAFIDKSGKVLFVHNHMRVGHFSCGRAQVFDSSLEIFKGKANERLPRLPVFNGYLDKQGKNAIQADAEHNLGKEFADGLAVMCKDNQFGYIDTFGNFVIQPQFASAASFSEGFAAIQIDDKWGFINKRGEIVISPAFSWAGQFHEGLAAVRVSKN